MGDQSDNLLGHIHAAQEHLLQHQCDELRELFPAAEEAQRSTLMAKLQHRELDVSISQVPW